MPKKKCKIIVVGKLRAFDEDAWKRLLMAYAYYLHEVDLKRASVAEPVEADGQGKGDIS